jgi:hypothetical protein
VSDPKYVPRQYLRLPSMFGRPSPYLQWAIPATVDEAVKLRAAQLQHEFSIRIREGLAARGSSKQNYAIAAGMSYDRFIKVLRGEAVMRIDDIAQADLLLGRVTEFDRPNAASSALRGNGIWEAMHNRGIGPATKDFQIGHETTVPRKAKMYPARGTI